MAKIIDFFNAVPSEQSESLLSWIQVHNNVDELRSVFFNLDCALKYVHDHGYFVSNFSPTEINVLNGSENCIQFRQLFEMPRDLQQADKVIQEDIFRSSYLQIAIYCNMLNRLNPQFLKEKFSDISLFLPSDDIPYYRGVVERGASVYLCDYRMEDYKRNLSSLGEAGMNSNNLNKIIKKNEYINSFIYKQINNLSNAAFVHFLIVPTIIFGFLFIVSIICWCLSLF